MAMNLLASSEYRFSKEVYDSLCKAASVGIESQFVSIVESVPAEDRARFGPTTFCSLHYKSRYKSENKSLLVVACNVGSLNIVKYLLEKYGDIIDINSMAMGWYYIRVRLSQMTVGQLMTPLIAACLSSNDDTIQYLVSKGADVNKADRNGNTPLHYVKSIEAAKCLVANGADINKLNDEGISVLANVAFGRFIDESRTIIKIMRYLLDNGATVQQYDGYTLMHTVKDPNVLQFLFDYGVSPMFSTTNNSTDVEYVPCPLYTHVASQADDCIVNMFLQRSDCPTECKINAYLLLGTFASSMDARYEHWVRALELMKKHNLQLTYPPPVVEYGYRTEIKTKEELDAVWDNELEVEYQCILINERCRGREILDVLIFLHKNNGFICKSPVTDRAIQLEEAICHQILSKPPNTYNYPRLKIGMSLLIDGTVGYCVQLIPDNPLYIKCGLAILRAHRHLSLPVKHIGVILRLFSKWIRVCTSSYPSSMILLAEDLVSEFLHYPVYSNLLYVGISFFSVSPSVLELILQAGADVVINDIVPVRDDYKHRYENTILHTLLYYHKRKRYFLEILRILIEYGAHIDTTNSRGSTIFTCSNRFIPSSFKSSHYLRSLYCLSANAVVHHCILYEGLLPPHVIHFIRLHDPNYFKSLQ